MIGLPASVRIYLASEPTDMRNGPDGLAARVRRYFSESAFSGHLFVFLSKRRDRVKILWWDQGGFVVYYKRLERSRFKRPQQNGHGEVVLSPAELQSLLEGIDLSNARRSPLWQPGVQKMIDADRSM
jgi:transposase